MSLAEPSSENYDKPVAYDAEGRPLYAHPPVARVESDNQNQAVHLMRPLEPGKLVISEAVKSKRNQSLRNYPNLNLSEGEYVILAIRRNPIGLAVPMMLGCFLILLATTLLFNFESIVRSFQFTGLLINSSVIILSVLLFVGLILIGMYVIFYVYFNNRFFLTNESVIQEIQTSIFSRLEQTVSLINIEDASFTQNGIIQQIFDFGAIRLSTEGEETTYRFTYVSNPKEVIATLNNAIEAFKNGRPITND